jgi:hypothetical protein
MMVVRLEDDRMAKLAADWLGIGDRGNRLGLPNRKGVISSRAPAKEELMTIEKPSVLPPIEEEDDIFSEPPKAKAVLPDLKESIAQIPAQKKAGRPSKVGKPWETEGISRQAWYKRQKKSKGEV